MDSDTDLFPIDDTWNEAGDPIDATDPLPSEGEIVDLKGDFLTGPHFWGCRCVGTGFGNGHVLGSRKEGPYLKNEIENEITECLRILLAQRRRDAEIVSDMNENEIGTRVLEAAINVHRELGPGLLETVYEVTLSRELSDLGLKVERQVQVPIIYKNIRFEEGFRADLIVENVVLLELKSVERVSPAHKKQVQTYLKLTGLKLGYLLNFGEAVLKNGISRCVNGLNQ
jgi:GxxExxY protein